MLLFGDMRIISCLHILHGDVLYRFANLLLILTKIKCRNFTAGSSTETLPLIIWSTLSLTAHFQIAPPFISFKLINSEFDRFVSCLVLVRLYEEIELFCLALTSFQVVSRDLCFARIIASLSFRLLPIFRVVVH